MDELTRRELLRLGLVAAVPGWLSGCLSVSEDPAINFFNWSRYIGETTIADFTRETGLKVRYEEFAEEEEMFAKLRSGARGYDLVVVSDYLLPRLKATQIVAPVPRDALKNFANIGARFQDPPYDPGNAFTVPYLWGTTGIAYNKQRLPAPPTSWKVLWDERYAGKLSMLDNVRDCIGVALLLLGKLGSESDERAIEEAKRLLLEQRPLVKQYTSTYIDALIAGELDLAMAWSGDALQAARENPQIDYVVPREGSFMWVDSLCLLRGAPHREGALRLIDFMLRGEVAAGIANTVRYATPNEAARPFLDKRLREDPRVFPPPKDLARVRLHASLDPAASALWNQAWSDVKIS